MKSIPQVPSLSLFDGKVCIVCKEWKSLSTYSRDKGKSDGRTVICKPCQSKRQHEWYLQNRERVLQDCKAKYLADPQSAKERQKQRYFADHEKSKEWHRNYYLTRREAIIQRMRAWEKNNPERKHA